MTRITYILGIVPGSFLPSNFVSLFRALGEKNYIALLMLARHSGVLMSLAITLCFEVSLLKLLKSKLIFCSCKSIRVFILVFSN